jgi:hypothetical protein
MLFDSSSLITVLAEFIVKIIYLVIFCYYV